MNKMKGLKITIVLFLIYHIDYVLCSSQDDTFAWFGGTGDIFDVTTKSTDKIGGEITNIVAGFASITFDYEFFSIDAAGPESWWI